MKLEKEENNKKIQKLLYKKGFGHYLKYTNNIEVIHLQQKIKALKSTTTEEYIKNFIKECKKEISVISKRDESTTNRILNKKIKMDKLEEEFFQFNYHKK